MSVTPNARSGAVPRTWFITGSSSGIGRAIAEHALRAGDRVAATARTPSVLAPLVEEFGDRVAPLALDVRDLAQVEVAVGGAVDAFGGLDVVVNAAGFGLLGALEETSDAELRDQLETNLIGTLSVMRAALPHLRERGAGHVINIASVGGLVGMAGVSAYNAAKFGVVGATEALAKELAPLGIHATVVEPGDVRTDFAGRSLALAELRLPAYDETAGAVRDAFPTFDGQQPGDPGRVAAAVYAVSVAPEPPVHLVLGSDSLRMLAGKTEAFEADLAAWRETTVSTDRDDA